MPVPENLPDPVRAALAAFSTAAEQAFGDDLVALVLFGSAAEGRLRPTSDVNLIVVLERCEPDRLPALGDAYQLARTAIRLSAMFILESEIKAAGEAFAVKFADIATRHAVICGRDVFGHLELSRGARLSRVRQVLMNLLLRLRERHVAEARFPERLAFTAADAVGPLRASAATLLLLRDGDEVAPREALLRLSSQNGQQAALETINKARESGAVPEVGGSATLFAAIELTATLQEIASHLS